MDNIIYFKSKNEIKNELIKIFNNIDNYIINNNFNEDIIKNFYNVYNKLRKDEWNDPLNVIFLEKFDKITKENDDFNKIMIELKYIELYDKLKKNLIILNNEEIRLIILATLKFNNLDDLIYQEIAKCFLNNMIQKDINISKNTKEKVCKVIDYIECIQNGENPIMIALNNHNNHYSKEIETKTDTIDNIYNYYLTQLDGISQFRVDLNINIIININKIKNIKKLSLSTQNKFINLTNTIKKLNVGILKEIDGISNLVEIFLHFKNEIDKIDIKLLETLFSYMYINKMSINEIDDFYRRL